jgi:hypothetical protein
MVYAASTLALAWANGANHVVLASEAEVQETAEVDGLLVQHPHLMYSAITQRSLGRLLTRRGLDYSSLTYPLQARKVRAMLWEGHRALARYQYTCWRHARGEGACSACQDCLKTVLAVIEAGAAPRTVGIDVARLFGELAEWHPRVEGGPLPHESVRRTIDGAIVRQLQRLRTRRVAWVLARTDPGQLAGRGALRTLRDYSRLRANSAAIGEPVPDEGYLHAFLDLVAERWRDRLEALFDRWFERAPAEADREPLDRIARRIARITEPLGPTS